MVVDVAELTVPKIDVAPVTLMPVSSLTATVAVSPAPPRRILVTLICALP